MQLFEGVGVAFVVVDLVADFVVVVAFVVVGIITAFVVVVGRTVEAGLVTVARVGEATAGLTNMSFCAPVIIWLAKFSRSTMMRKPTGKKPIDLVVSWGLAIGGEDVVGFRLVPDNQLLGPCLTF